MRTTFEALGSRTWVDAVGRSLVGVACAVLLGCGETPDEPLPEDGVSSVVAEVTVGTDAGVPVTGAAVTAIMTQPPATQYGPIIVGTTDTHGSVKTVVALAQAREGAYDIVFRVGPPKGSSLLPDSVKTSAYFRRNVLDWQLDTIRISVALRSQAGTH